MQAYKPGSVDPPEVTEGLIIYLAPASQPGSISLPTPTFRHKAGDPAELTNLRTQDQGLFGLSTRKVFRAPAVTFGAVGSYSTFSPFPPPKTRVVYFLWHYLSPGF